MNHNRFEVVGAGQIQICDDDVCLCGSAHGLALDCSWSKFGMSGGVMDVREVRRLHEALTIWLAQFGAIADKRELPALFRVENET